jgi:RHS repeat-associated protein
MPVGAATVEYVRGPDMGGGVGGLLYSVRGGAASLTHSSARGDVIAKADETGALTWQAQYEAFGRRPVETGVNLDRQRANSKEEDPTGLLNEGFRYRDLETGTFITRDPIGFKDGPNLYTYVRQNPWTAFDPHGLILEVANELQEPLQRARETDARVDHMFQHLKESTHLHVIRTTDSDANQYSIDDAGNKKQRERLTNGEGLGTLIVITPKPSPSKHEKGLTFSVEEKLAHEAFHSFLTDIGMSDASIDPKTKTPREEQQAVAVENVVRKKVSPKEEPRKDYGGRPSSGYDYLNQHPTFDFVGQKLTEREQFKAKQQYSKTGEPAPSARKPPVVTPDLQQK